MKRTTAGISKFRISCLTKSPKRTKLPADANDESIDWRDVDGGTTASVDSDVSCVEAGDTLKEITADNAKLRKSNDLQEKTFDIELDEPLLKEMRDDTRLVIVDIPGINEAGTRKLYLDYVAKTWDTYDAMIVVMDARQGVNTDEQVGLLKFVKKNLTKKKKVPVIVVCNKVDDPDDDELMALVAEARKEVEKIFNVHNCTKALKAITNGKSNDYGGTLSPAFLPTSAENAFLYRSASKLQLGGLKRLDKVYLDRIGQEEVGKFKWKKLSDEKKYELVLQVVSDPATYKERLEASNFDKLLDLLQFFVGGKKTQVGIIEKQLEVSLAKMSITNGITGQLTAVFDRCSALGKDASHLDAKFWSLYRQCHKEAFEKFHDNPTCISDMNNLMQELITYARGLHKKLVSRGSVAAEENGMKKIIDSMKKLIKQQINVILEKEAGWKPESLSADDNSRLYLHSWSWQEGSNRWCNSYTGARARQGKNEHPADAYPETWTWDGATKKWRSKYSGKEVEGTQDRNPMAPSLTWARLSHKDWSTIVSSILTLSRRNIFNENFGEEIANLEWMVRTGNFTKPEDHCFECSARCNHNRYCSCVKHLKMYNEYMQGTYTFGVFTPNDKAKYDMVVHVKVPDSISDPSHWGHLAWLFCEFMESLAS